MKTIEFLTNGGRIVTEVLVDGEKFEHVIKAAIHIVPHKPPTLTIEVAVDGIVLVVDGVEVTLDARKPEDWEEPWAECGDCAAAIAYNTDYTCPAHAADWRKHMAFSKRRDAARGVTE